MPMLFDAYAQPVGAGGERCLDLPLFTSTYAAILFATFDANNDGVIQPEEFQAQLAKDRADDTL